MQEVKVFENQEFGQVRTVLINNEPYFVLKDICDVLELSNPTIVASRLEDDEVTKLDLGGLSGESNVVNESGLYNVVLRSDKPNARKFRKWVTTDVLPTIRKHGMYATEELLNDPDLFISVLQDLKKERLARQEAQLKIEMDKPKVEFFDAVSGSKDAIEMKSVSAVIDFRGVGRNRLFSILREAKILDKDNVPYQEFIDRNYFRVIEQKFKKPDGNTYINIKTLVYQKGVDYIVKTLIKLGYKKKEAPKSDAIGELDAKLIS